MITAAQLTTNTTTVILAKHEPQTLVGTKGSVPAMTRGLLVHPEHANQRPTRITGLN